MNEMVRVQDYIPSLDNFQVLLFKTTGLREHSGELGDILAGLGEKDVIPILEKTDPVYGLLSKQAKDPENRTAAGDLHELLNGNMPPSEYDHHLAIARGEPIQPSYNIDGDGGFRYR